MSSTTSAAVAEWDNEYARLVRGASQLRTVGWSNNNNNAAQKQQQQALQQTWMRLNQSLRELPLPPGEIQRRQRLLQHLQQQQSMNPNSATNTDLLSQQQLQQPQQSKVSMAMMKQDQMIDELAVGVGRLKNQTTAIHEESRMHVNLLNDMDTNLDAAQASLQDQTTAATRLREDRSIWRLQLIVAGLCVLLVLLILLGLSP